MSKIISKPFILMAMMLLLLSCSKTTPGTGEGENVIIEFQVGFGFPSTRATDNGTPQERVIQRIRIMSFNSSTLLLEHQLYDEDNSPAGFPSNPVVLNMTVVAGSKILCAVANEPPALKTALDAITTFSDLEALTIGDENTYNLPNTALPLTQMVGVNVVPSYNAPISIGLKRGVGKVEIDLIKDIDNTKSVYLKSTQVIRTPKKSTLMHHNPQSPTQVGLLTDIVTTNYSVNNELLSVIGSEFIVTPKYLYEHYRGVGAAAAAKGTAVKIELDDAGVTKFYEIPIIGNYENGTPIYAIIRNVITRIHVTVYGEHIKVDYELMPWGVINPYDKDPGKDDSNIIFTDWIKETIYDVVLPST